MTNELHVHADPTLSVSFYNFRVSLLYGDDTMMQNNVYKSNKLSSMPSLATICPPIVAHFISLQEIPFLIHILYPQ